MYVYPVYLDSKAQIWMDISNIGKEAFIHWNGPHAARVDSLGEATLDRRFGTG